MEKKEITNRSLKLDSKQLYEARLIALETAMTLSKAHETAEKLVEKAKIYEEYLTRG